MFVYNSCNRTSVLMVYLGYWRRKNQKCDILLSTPLSFRFKGSVNIKFIFVLCRGHSSFFCCQSITLPVLICLSIRHVFLEYSFAKKQNLDWFYFIIRQKHDNLMVIIFIFMINTWIILTEKVIKTQVILWACIWEIYKEGRRGYFPGLV